MSATCHTSARVAVNAWGAWVGYCPECNETASGSRRHVEIWADAHIGQEWAL